MATLPPRAGGGRDAEEREEEAGPGSPRDCAFLLSFSFVFLFLSFSTFLGVLREKEVGRPILIAGRRMVLRKIADRGRDFGHICEKNSSCHDPFGPCVAE